MTSDELLQLPFARPGVLDIAPLYRTLQAKAPITPVRTPAGDVAWLVTGYAEVKTGANGRPPARPFAPAT